MSAFKFVTTKYSSKTCDGVTFSIFNKTWGRRIDLEAKMAEYNQLMREFGDKRQMVWEEARAKAEQTLYGIEKKAETLVHISRAKSSVDDAETPSPVVQTVSTVRDQESPTFKLEMYRNLDLRTVGDLDVKANTLRMSRLRPIYMDVYLHSVSEFEMEDGTPLKYMSTMAESDKERFYRNAPGELIDEIFEVLASKISMTDVEKENFGLPTTGSLPAVGKTEDTTAPSASQPDSTDTGNAESPKSSD